MPRRAFTVVELLVTIGVVTLLVGLLLPAVSGVRAAGRQTVCQSNLRQMTMAAQQYAAISDAWPNALTYERRHGSLVEVAWDWRTTFDGRVLGPGALWTYTDDPERVLQCPDYHGPANAAAEHFSGYNYNTTFLGAEGNFHPAGSTIFRKGVRPHACRRTSSCAMFGCGGSRHGANKFMRAPVTTHGLSPATVYSGGQAFRHRGTTDVAWIDGHVGIVQTPCEGADATPALLDEWLDHPRNGFLSDDDSAYDPR